MKYQEKGIGPAYGQETIASADATTFATALHVLGTAQQWRRCLEILQQMQVGTVVVIAIPGCKLQQLKCSISEGPRFGPN